MKKFLFAIFAFLCAGVVAHAGTMTLNWLNENGTVNQTTNCELGGDLILPAAPTKNGYTFQGWTIQNYTQIEYLESTGTQWIDTGYSAPNGYKAHIKFMPTLVTNFHIIGAHNKDGASSPGRNILGVNAAMQVELGAGGMYLPQGLNLVANKIEELIFSTIIDDIYVEGYSLYYKGDASNDRSIYPLYIMNINYPRGRAFVGRFYFAQIWDSNNSLVRDFIPVLDGNGTPCMLDKVTGQFFYNQGTGQFIAGPVVNQ